MSSRVTVTSSRIGQLRTTPRLAPPSPEPAGESSIVNALRDQLRAQKRHYESEIADLKAEVKKLQRELAAALERSTASATPATHLPANVGDTVTDQISQGAGSGGLTVVRD